MALTYYERGKIQGQLKTALMQLEVKFGPLFPAVRDRVTALSPERLEQLLLDLLRTETLKELGLED